MARLIIKTIILIIIIIIRMKINVFVLWHRLVTEAIHVAQKQSLEWPDGSDVYASFYVTVSVMKTYYKEDSSQNEVSVKQYLPS